MSTQTTTPAAPPAGACPEPCSHDRCRSTRRPMRSALTDTLPLLTGMVPFGVVVGVTATVDHFDGPATLLASAALYAGTSQMAGFAQLAAGSLPVAVIATIMIVNARLLLYGAALEHRFRPQPRWFRWLAPAFIIDQTYATALDRAPDPVREFRRYWLTLGGAVLVGWTSSIGAGMALGPFLPSGLPLEAAGIACLLGLLVPRLTERPAAIAALVATVAAVLGARLPSGTGILLATVLGMAAGAVCTRRADR
jgi:predicted branched-subunit amino acid permease